MLRIIVHNAERVPSLERGKNVNPLVEINFQGITKKTNCRRITCDPKWDETLDFPLGNIPIKETDTFKIHLYNHQKNGIDKLIGQNEILLNEVIASRSIHKYPIQLNNSQGIPIEATKLYLTLAYTPPIEEFNDKLISKNNSNSTENLLSQKGDETLVKTEIPNDQLIQFQSKPLSIKPQDYQIRVKIFECRQLKGSNIHPVCHIRIFKQTKQTKICKGTNNPYFNEVFFFNLNLSEKDLFDENIEFSVYNSRTFRSDMKIGIFKIDIAFIYSQKKHTIHRKWLLLSDENDPMTGAQGYLKVSVNILGPGDEPPSDDNMDDHADDDIESNVLKPAGLMLRPATFVLKLYKAEDLPRMDNAFFNGVKNVFKTAHDIKELIDPYVKFAFAGHEISSKIVYTCSHPEFNQELRLGLKFPSMCDKITLTVMDWDRLQFDDITATASLPIRAICDDRENGFLPTFGPCWINLYGSPREYSQVHTELNELNTGKGEGAAYRGRIFIELETIPNELPNESITEISNSNIIYSLPYQSRKKYKLHAAFLDAYLLYEHDSTIEFEITIGNYGNKFDDSISNGNCSTTPPTNPVFDGTSYYFLPWENIKPCVQVISEWEDVTFRLETINYIQKIQLFINGLISTLDLLKLNKLSEDNLLRHYKKSLELIISHLKKPLPNPDPIRHYLNELDRLKRQTRERDLANILDKLEQLKYHAKTSDEILQNLEDIQQILEYLQLEPQSCIPDVIIWLLSNGKRSAYCRIPANELFYSENLDYSGHLCGQIQTITLKWPGKDQKNEFLPAEIRVKIWFGLAIHEKDWSARQQGAQLTIYAETYENQTNVLGQWTTTGPLMTRPSWSDVTGNMSLPKEHFQVPSGWKWEGDWYIHPEIKYADDAGFRKYTEDIYENQYRLIAGAQWQPKAITWTNLNGDKVRSKDERNEAPIGWEWEDDWTIDIHRPVDQEGFEYSVNQSIHGWCPVEKLFHLNRRRRWFRTRILKIDSNIHQIKKRSTGFDLKNGGWEYAPMFNMKFHHDERSMDMTRRRRWHRKMIPDYSISDENLSKTDIVFRIQSNLDQQKSVDKNIKIEFNAPRIFLTFTKAYYYELRAYIYQARNLLSMDNDSFSDPYAQIAFANQSQRTEVIQKTLCPIWDQTLIFSNIEFYGEPDEIYHNPPNILIELFDKDEYGGPDFLGRVQCLPIVRLTSDENKSMTKLKWFKIKRGKDSAGELLAAFELFLVTEEQQLPAYPSKRGLLYNVPELIRPELVRTGIEILCWGLRNMKTFHLSDVNCPQVIFEVGDQQIESTIIKNLKKTPNFDKPLLFLDVMLPKEDYYAPPINIKVKDHRSFGRKPIVGFHIIKSLENFHWNPTKPSLTFVNLNTKQSDLPTNFEQELEKPLLTTEIPKIDKLKKKSMRKRIKHFLKKYKSNEKYQDNSKWIQIQKVFFKNQYHSIEHRSNIDEDIDWWSKYYASKGEFNRCGTYLSKGYEKLTIYSHSLESFELYEGFKDFCRTFELYRGKTKFEEENEIVGEFKGFFKVYQLDTDEKKIYSIEKLPLKQLEDCLIRIYIIRGIDLQPKDSNGQSDPYIEIQLGKIKIDNRDEKIPNTTNPIFGKMFELKTTIPLAKDLIIRIKDWDFLFSDDLIGETIIDLENRLLSKYRPICGLPLQYHITGANQWRDNVTPRKILVDVCKRNNLPTPQLLEDHSIQIGDLIFRLNDFQDEEKHLTADVGEDEERLALYILHKLQLSPEHIETRPLYNPLQPLIEQGRIELFVDIFPQSYGPPGPPFHIQPRKPKTYILRCIIWNTSDVILQETSITGEQMSDIYVKGWMSGLEDDSQKTDVHYRSMDGQGNFNWRFVYTFAYFPAERCLSIKKKEHFWSYDPTELKIPPILNLQIWDNDKFTPDDFLGALTLDLNHLYKPAKDADVCTLKNLNNQLENCVSIFEIKRLKGWWPCVDLQSGKPQLTGKIELELEILTEQEAEERPAGRAREKPNQHPTLESPKRPETSFLWFSSPYRTFKNIIWKKSKWYIVGILILAILIIFIVLFLWALPNVVLSRLFRVSI